MNKIVFDLDGVLRDLYEYLYKKFNIFTPEDYSWEHQGISIFDIIKNDKYMALVKAPPTEYLKYVKRYITVPEIWTKQPYDWRPYTFEWLKMYLKKFDVKFMDTEEKRNKLDEENGYVLIEDCPLFTNYKRIVLVDRPYNRHISNVYRVSTQKEFERLFLEAEVKI